MSGFGRDRLRTLLSHGMVRRIIASTGSNAYSQATTIAIQLFSLPLFLSKWGVETYGHWLILSAIPSYLSMADVGMVTAAGNRMTMLIGEGNARLANQVFQSALAFVLSVGALAMLIVVAVVSFMPLDVAEPAQWRWAIVLLSAGVVVSLAGGFPEAVYKATHRYALGNALSNTTRLFEWIGSLVGLWVFDSFAGVAFGALVPRVLATVAMVIHCARTTPDFRWGFGSASTVEVKRCVAPAVSFMAFPIANALNFQGMTLIAAATLGPAATVVLNTYRTLARVTVQATSTFSTALWPEFSRLFGQHDLATLTSLYRRSRAFSILLALVASVAVYLAAPTVLHYWTKHEIAFSAPLMLLSMVYAAVAGGWHVSRILLLSTNLHRGLAWPFLIASAVCLPLAWVLADAFGVIGIVLAMLVLEVGMLVLCYVLAERVLTEPGHAHRVEALA